MLLHELTDYLESIAPLRFQESYDNAGLLVGDPQQMLNGVMISLDATVEVVQEAIEKDCNIVVSHHPIIFRGIKKFDPHYYVNKAIIHAIKNNIALYAIHTNLDNVLSNGVNQKIAQRLELEDIQILKPKIPELSDSTLQIGSGVIGLLQQPMTNDVFIDHLKNKMNLRIVKHTARVGKSVQKVALCGGSGSFLVSTALIKGADVFVTADMKYHEYFDANGQMVIMDIGHYESEYFTIELLYDLISKKYPNFAAHCTKVNTNPVFYS